MRRSAFFFCILAALAALGGCRPQNISGGGIPPTKRYRTVASLSPSATEILGSSFYGISLVGKTASCNWPTNQTNVPIVLNGVKPNYERLAEIRPMAIVYDGDLFSQSDVERLRGLGADVFAVAGNTLEEFEDSLYKLGAELHGESLISDYVDRIQGAVSSAAGAPPVRKLKVAVIMPGNGSEHMIAGTGSFVADEVRKSQGEPVGPDANNFVNLSAESLVALNPDVIVAAGKADSLRKDARLQSIVAIKNKHILETDPDILLRRGGRVDKLIRGLYGYFETVAQGG